MTELSTLYRTHLYHCWVEDTLTRHYLNALWSAPDLKLWVGAGSALRGIVEASRAEIAALRIFWMNDGDWAPSTLNEVRSGAMNYRLCRHEIENYLLDEDAIASAPRLKMVRRGLDAAQVASALAASAQRLVYVVAASRTLHTLIQKINVASWPTQPTLASCPDEGTASSWLAAQLDERREALRAVQRGADDALNARGVAASLRQEIQSAQQELYGGDWRRTYPGKEILRGAWGAIFTARQDAAAEADLAKHVAAYQRVHDTPLYQELAPWLDHMRS